MPSPFRAPLAAPRNKPHRGRANRQLAALAAAAGLGGLFTAGCTADSVLRPVPSVDIGMHTAAIVAPARAIPGPPAPVAAPPAAPAQIYGAPALPPAFPEQVPPYEEPGPMPADEQEALLAAPAPSLPPAPEVEQPKPILAALPRVMRPRLDQPSPGMPAGEIALRRELKRLGVRYVDLPPINDGGGCRIDYPVKVTGLSGGIELKPAATLNATLAATFAKYVRSDFAPAVRWRYFSGIRTIYTGSTYSCRNMIGESTNHLSEHAKGNAIDVMKVKLDSGRVVDVERPGLFAFRQRGFLDRVRGEACGYFTTVLGPGYNRAHADHFHFDLKQRRNGYVACR